MSFIEKLKGRTKEILRLDEVETEFGPGYRILVKVGNSNRVCHLIQDKHTGEWKTLGDPNACRILSRNLYDLGTPLTGATQSEKIKEQGL